MRIIGLLAGILVALTSTDAYGILIVEYTSASSTDNATLTASDSNSNVTADVMAAGSGLTANAGATWNWNDWDEGTSFATAFAADNFWTWGFDLDAGSGVNLDLTTFDIRLDRSGSGPSQFDIQVSVNGGTAVSVLSDTSLSDSGETYTNVDLSSIANILPGDSVVFTLAAWSASSGGGTFDLENIGGGAGLTVNGDLSAIPEPSAFIFGGLVCGVLGLNYLRKKRSAAVDPAVA